MTGPSQQSPRPLPPLSFRWVDIASTAIVALLLAATIALNVLVEPIPRYSTEPQQKQRQAD